MSASRIAAIFRVPAHMVNDLERATFSNIEEMGQEFDEVVGRLESGESPASIEAAMPGLGDID